jgi:hypothetical protein
MEPAHIPTAKAVTATKAMAAAEAVTAEAMTSAKTVSASAETVTTTAETMPAAAHMPAAAVTAPSAVAVGPNLRAAAERHAQYRCADDPFAKHTITPERLDGSVGRIISTADPFPKNFAARRSRPLRQAET